MQTNPEQWADKVLDDVIVAWSEHGHSAGIEAIQAAFAEREAQRIAMEKRARDLSIMIVQHLGGGSEWFSRVGDEYYADPKAIIPELQRRETGAQITKSALVRANRANAEQAEREARLVGALEDVINPLGYLKRHAEARGSHLNGMAYQIAHDPTFAKSIAKEALAALRDRT